MGAAISSSYTITTQVDSAIGRANFYYMMEEY